MDIRKFIDDNGVEAVLKHISGEAAIEYYGADNLLREFNEQDINIFTYASAAEAVEYFDNSDLLDEIGISASVDHWDTSDVFGHIDGWDYCRDNYYDSMYDYVLDDFNMSDRWDVEDVVSHYGKSELMDELLSADHKLVMQCTYNYVEDDELLNFFLQECDTDLVETKEHIKLISLIRLNNRK